MIKKTLPLVLSLLIVSCTPPADLSTADKYSHVINRCLVVNKKALLIPSGNTYSLDTFESNFNGQQNILYPGTRLKINRIYNTLGFMDADPRYLMDLEILNGTMQGKKISYKLSYDKEIVVQGNTLVEKHFKYKLIEKGLLTVPVVTETYYETLFNNKLSLTACK